MEASNQSSDTNVYQKYKSNPLKKVDSEVKSVLRDIFNRKEINTKVREEAFVQTCSAKGVLRNFVKFTGKHLPQRLFYNKVAGLRPEACNFIIKESLAQVFSCEFWKISKNTYFYRTPLVAASVREDFIYYIRYTRGHQTYQDVL